MKEIQYFVYVWYDLTRKMFYVGSHCGHVDDSYISSSRWLTCEVKYRPEEFKRKIIKYFDTKEEMVSYEYYLISLIDYEEFGVKYYNSKSGRKKGCVPWNKGKTGIYSDNVLKKMSDSAKGRIAWNKGKPNPQAADNARKGSKKLSEKVKGRKRKYLDDGSWTWEYPNT